MVIGMVATFAGNGAHLGIIDGTVSSARFGYVTGLALSTSGVLYVSDALSNTIRLISNGYVYTIAGGNGATVAGSQDGFGTRALLSAPQYMGLAPTGMTIYLADYSSNSLRTLSLSGGL
jgi:sugar lactone lactonase YvrE